MIAFVVFGSKMVKMGFFGGNFIGARSLFRKKIHKHTGTIKQRDYVSIEAYD